MVALAAASASSRSVRLAVTDSANDSSSGTAVASPDAGHPDRPLRLLPPWRLRLGRGLCRRPPPSPWPPSRYAVTSASSTSAATSSSSRSPSRAVPCRTLPSPWCQVGRRPAPTGSSGQGRDVTGEIEERRGDVSGRPPHGASSAASRVVPTREAGARTARRAARARTPYTAGIATNSATASQTGSSSVKSTPSVWTINAPTGSPAPSATDVSRHHGGPNVRCRASA